MDGEAIAGHGMVRRGALNVFSVCGSRCPLPTLRMTTAKRGTVSQPRRQCSLRIPPPEKGDLFMSIGLQIFTIVHVAISLVGIAAGFVVVRGLLSSKPLNGATAIFLAFTAL